MHMKFDMYIKSDSMKFDMYVEFRHAHEVWHNFLNKAT
jgi:hypothetical protein